MSKRILGGRTSRPGRWPWQCSLQSEPSGHICGCVLIAKRWVLTVAHCFEGRENAAVWKVVLGISNLDHPSSFMQTRLVRTIILHPRYNRAVVDYDISIVELDEDINETSYVRPVCLPSKDQLVQPDTYCYITGWGHMGNKMPFKLQEGEVRIISLEQCQSYFDMKIITSRMLCAGYESGTVDSCMLVAHAFSLTSCDEEGTLCIHMALQDIHSQGQLSAGPYYMLEGLEEIDGFVHLYGTGHIKAHMQVSKGV
ncbi:hypothetical protein DUI87_09214 [Hirundo rustica rustica]|uniref:Peptidase S1 domain-containing protein n=1 Tax=Hirundo rustica rustica TaxID=333673 RepID=A0A3M0KM07_HIRRU|nr:hypothetical protein DUI87_09214 [Hirundo rustica rustica]